MNKLWKVAVAGTAALALIIAAPAFTGAQKKRAAQSSDAVIAERAVLDQMQRALDDLDTQELGKLSAELENKLQRVHEQLARKMAEIDSTVTYRAERAAEVAAQHAQLAAALDTERLREQLTQAELAAELAAQQAEEKARAFAWTDHDGQQATAWYMDSDGDGWLGVNVSEVSAEKAKELKLPAERGVLISDVDSDSAAGKAGLKSGDVVTEFNGQRVEGATQFRRMIRETPAGRTVQLTVWRDGKSQNISVTLGSQRDRVSTLFRDRLEPLTTYSFSMPRLEAFGVRAPVLGVQIEDVSGQLGSYFGAPDGEGVLVKHVNTGSAAEKAGLKAGDVITKIDGTRVRDSSEMRSRMRELREKDSVTISVVRKGAETSVKVELEKPVTTPRKVATRSYRL